MDTISGSSSMSRSSGALKKCNCGLPAKIYKSKTEKNPGRRFFGCKMYKTTSINCFGCCNRERPLVVEVDEPSKGLKIQGRVVKKDGGSSDGLWSTSTCDMDHNITIRSQSSNPLFDPQCSTSNSTEFVNHGNYLNVLRPS
ncbi:predicted protein [Arabidopsis lyrata subsp. lyrata]|uniref:Predicted protein n=1 Tax=Arabidopsis lyrata subsp. lyrata TaxID=81972 RepID=D7MA58_ARALL|nr:predicted protein [Arabidopsis lyrata subsp. lyrata]